jgi:carbon-monoxide dehydrogenase large subunit
MTMTDEPTDTGVIGTRVLRKEDPALLTGEAVFTNDMKVPGALCTWPCCAARTPMPKIVSIDTSRRAAMPGVHAVYTGADLADLWAAPMPCAWPVTDDMKNPPHYPIAIDKVHYVGDGVAVVLADSDTIARDAIEAIDVEYDPGEPSSTSSTRCPTASSSTPSSAPTRRTRGTSGRGDRRAPSRRRSTRPPTP